jgi:streptomycin 6-kinase
MSPVPHYPDIETVYLAAFTNEHANAVAEKLEEAGIAWWYKQPGFFSRIWEYGAVRLFEHDADRHALLLERCSPGTPLSDVPADEALDTVVGLLPRLWKKAGPPFRSLQEESGVWAGELEQEWERAGEPFERRLVDAALEFWAAAYDAPGEQVLVNQDMHADNVLRADREPWLVIDPKPLTGEREFGIAALIRGGELGEGPDAVRYRFDRLTAELGLDRDRARGWAFSQTLAWSHEDGLFDGDTVEVARWIFDQ